MCDLVVICGRFQTPSIELHDGYKYLFAEAAKIAPSILIVLGTSKVRNERNILSYVQREGMIRHYFLSHLPRVKINLCQIFDCNDNEQWYGELNKKVKLHCKYSGKTNPLYLGSRDSFLSGFQYFDYPFLELETNIDMSSTLIRNNIEYDEYNEEFIQGYLDELSDIITCLYSPSYLKGCIFGFLTKT